MIIEVLDWDTYNPRKDIKTLTWFRVEADIGFDRKLFGLAAEGKWLWIFLIAFAAQENSGVYEIELDFLEEHVKVKKEKIASYLKFLEKKKLLTIDKATNGSVQTRTDTNESVHYTTEHNGTEPNTTGQDGTELIVGKAWPDYSKIKTMWNTMVLALPKGTFTKCETVSVKREGFINSSCEKLKQLKSEDGWKEYFDKVSKTGFLKGSNDRNWKADFEWCIQNANALKVIEGRYDSMGMSNKSQRATEQVRTLVDENPYNT